jgi:hypothetical protein
MDIKNIAVLFYTVWSGLYITNIDSDTVTIRYGYQTSDGMVYKRRITRPLEYNHKPEWSDEETPSFTYKGDRYFLDEFIML